MSPRWTWTDWRITDYTGIEIINLSSVFDDDLLAATDGLQVQNRSVRRLAELAQRYMGKIGDARTVQADPGVRYFGALLADDTLVPGSGPRLGKIDFETWFSRSGASK